MAGDMIALNGSCIGGTGGVGWCGRPTHSLNHSPIRAEETREVLLTPFNRGEN